MNSISGVMTSNNDQIGMRLEDYPGGFRGQLYEFPEVRYYHRDRSVISAKLFIQGCYGDAGQAQAAEGLLTEAKTWPGPASVASKIGFRVAPRPLDPACFEENPPEPYYCRVFTVTTMKNPSIKAPTLVTRGKNLGRINSTTIFHQALIEAYSDYKKLAASPKREYDPGSPHLHEAKNNRVTAEIAQVAARIPPMLVADEDPQAWFGAQTPGYVVLQPKLDGTRLMAIRRSLPAAVGNGLGPLDAYSRNCHPVAPNNFFGELEDLCGRNPNVFFDGEMYAHGVSLQRIAGTSKNLGKGGSTAVEVQFVIYDLYDPALPNAPYADRFLRYRAIGEAVPNYKFIRFLDGLRVPADAPFALVKTQFDLAIDKGFEGLVMKSLGAGYEPSYNGYRSRGCCKYKKHYTAEFMVVDWARGEGKQTNLVSTWTVQIVAATRSGNVAVDLKLQGALGRRFKCNIKAIDETRAAWFAEFATSPAAFESNYRGLYATLEFFDVSEDGVPMQPYWIAFRDYEGGKIRAPEALALVRGAAVVAPDV
jgi:hypothetical protein